MAIAELHTAGIADPTARQIAVRAADIATRPAVPDEQRVPTPPTAAAAAEQKELAHCQCVKCPDPVFAG